jgi:hypothetical protein
MTRRAPALALLLALLLTGCSRGEDRAAPAPGPTTAPDPTTSATTPAPAQPSASGSSTSPPSGGATSTLGTPRVPAQWSPADFRGEVTTADGRRVVAYHVGGTGLVVQVRPAGASGWTPPRTLVASKDDPCQGVTLRTGAGTVALTAGFGLYCYDGEPPRKVVAAVLDGSGDGSWDVRTIDDVDDFRSVQVDRSGAQVDFEGDGGTLTWRRGDGFD